MMRTWDIWAQDGGRDGPIDVEHYEACGGVDDALSRHADEAYFELADGRRRAIAELMFKRITELGDDHREIRRPTPLAEIAAVASATPAEVEECISHFAEQGRSFVTVSADGVVDISHESLIRQWPRLRAWVREEADSRDVYRRLADAADRWERGEAALLRDPDLQIVAKWWTENQPNQAGPTATTRPSSPRPATSIGAGGRPDDVEPGRSPAWPRWPSSPSSPRCSPYRPTGRRTGPRRPRRRRSASGAPRCPGSWRRRRSKQGPRAGR